jgi:hypothetical protein
VGGKRFGEQRWLVVLACCNAFAASRNRKK